MKRKLAGLVPAGLALALAAAPLGAYAAGPKFQSAVPAYTLPVGSSINDIAFADLDGDGHLDAIVSDNSSLNNRIAIFKGNGDGTLQSTPDYLAVGDNPREIAVADLNGDGKLDIAVTSYDDDKVTVLLGNGDGTFMPGTAYGAGEGPNGIAAADLDEDGFTDLAIASHDNHQLAVLYGNRFGTFPAPVYYSVGTYPLDVIVRDFDKDGHPDLAVSNDGSGSISVLLNRGSQNFDRSDFGGIQTPTFLVSGDFNGDEFVDLATADNGSSGGAAVLLGVGDGSFRSAVLYSTGLVTYPNDIAKGDFDGDGQLDLAVKTQSGIVSIYNGNADGTFQAKFDLPFVGYLASADLNEDGLADLAYASGTNLSLLNSRAEGVLAFSASTFTVSEDGGNAIVTVNRTSSAYGQTKVRIQTSDGTAVSGTNYTAVDATIVFDAGETTKTYLIPILDDGVHGMDRTFGVTISAPTNEAALGSQTSATVTILEDATAPVVDPAKFVAVDNYSGTPDQLAGDAAAVSEAGATLRAYRWTDADSDGVVDAGELGAAIALGASGADGSVASADIGDLAPGAYKFVVTAEDAAGNESPRTAAAVVTVTLTKDLPPDVAAPTWPAGAELSVTAVTYERLKLAWPAAADDRGVDHYELTQDGGAPVVLPAATLSRDIEGLTASTAYAFSVVTVDAAGNRSTALAATATTLPYPEPAQPTVASGEARLQLLTITADASPVSLSPAFDMNVLAYEATTTESRIMLNAEPFSPAATLLINGKSAVGKLPLAIDLDPGKNALQIEVRAANGSVRMYSLTVMRQEKPPVVSCFGDIRGHWAEEEINEACALGIVQGGSEGLFRPDSPITRAEWAVMIARWLNSDTQSTPAVSGFADAAGIPAWAREAIAAAAGNGILNGYPDGTFRPAVTINRAETAATLVRAARWTTDSAAVTEFADDVSIPSWAKPYAAAAAMHGILSGKDGNRFAPASPTTRAEAAAMLVRLTKLSNA
ncbi:Cadherin-like beta sandwich domain-containing protein [Cohnella sp. OV330]|uniref:FG-GAP-like repeat-containing protein n=1 Tax=Cohnella sp. OV330 TaxID=1855288 RepID=UPI0008EF4A46|nr:FG-GAP-like repeat-containing protein [Cohnella sp. OV330]SFA73818.1 Cadherin-like beta sandwich domain-containing protein [Cohnella sp. OV330]